MIGAIAGDICGSTFEMGSCKRADFRFFRAGSKFTDDTVCTVAVAEALLGDADFAGALRRWVSRYPNRCYGGMFVKWAAGTEGPYNSFGNGGAMRVAPAGLLATSLEEAEFLAEQSAAVTHNHPEGVKGAQAVAAAIWWARQGVGAAEMRVLLSQRYGYDLSATVAEMASTDASKRFSALAQDTVPQALIIALEANSWEDAVVYSVEVGGDSDTLAAMSGAIAEARFGMAPAIAARALKELPLEMQKVVTALYARAGLPFPWVTAPAPAADSPA
jgi:ADP-ribosylglycohydrolase